MSAGTAGVARQTRQGQVIDVVAGARLVGTGLAVTGNRDINQPRIDRLQGFIAQAQPLHHAGAKLFQDDVMVIQ
jgi:hypothetical protein